MLFDIDGTLFDTPASMLAAARSALAGFGVEPALLDRGAGIWLADAQGRYEAYLAGELTFVEQRTRRVRDLFAELGRLDPGPDRAADWLTAYRSAQLDATVAFADVAATLAGCASYVLGAVTNNDGAWQRTRLTHLGLHGRIGAVIGIDDAGAAKPDARIFHAGCAALGLEPGEVAYVGDDLALDARGAAAAGLYGIWLDRLGAGPDPVDVPWIRSLGELPEVLTRFGASGGVR